MIKLVTSKISVAASAKRRITVSCSFQEISPKCAEEQLSLVIQLATKPSVLRSESMPDTVCVYTAREVTLC